MKLTSAILFEYLAYAFVRLAACLNAIYLRAEKMVLFPQNREIHLKLEMDIKRF